jgi:cellulose synthase/poly-beta-1,6-N-acetylglucosamine synthase-like glycosyltransferase
VTIIQTQTLLKPVTFSVGICAVTETKTTLQIAGQVLTLYDPDFTLNELIVATPNKTLATSLTNVDRRIKVLREKQREGKARALRKIIKESTGDILVLASADIKLEKQSVGRLVHALAANSSLGIVDSKVEMLNGEKLLMDRVSTLLWGVHNATLDELDACDRLGHVAGDLFAVRRSLIETLPDVINDDAFLALKVRERGFQARRIHDAVVWIIGPRTPIDYVYQRSRVLRGHLQLIMKFGKVPSTFEFQFIFNPRRYLRIFVDVVAKQSPPRILPIFVAGILELLSFQFALVSSLLKRRYGPWRLARTTKWSEIA